MKKIKVGVIGCGVMGGFHVKQYKNITDVELVGISDADPSRKIDGIKFFSNYNELLDNVDAVSIATPTFTHYEIADAALEKGVNVLIEKPIAMSVDEGRKLVSKGKMKKLVLTVGHIERFSPAYMKIEQAFRGKRPDVIDIKRFSPFPARITDVSCVMDIMIHDIDLARKLAGSDVICLSATGSMIKTNRLDKAHAILVFGSGTVANIQTSRVNDEKVRNVIVAEGKTVYCADLLNKTVLRQSSGKKETIVVADHDQLKYELMCFIGSITGHSQPVVTGDDGLAALDIAEKVEAAALKQC